MQTITTTEMQVQVVETVTEIQSEKEKAFDFLCLDAVEVKKLDDGDWQISMTIDERTILHVFDEDLMSGLLRAKKWYYDPAMGAQ